MPDFFVAAADIEARLHAAGPGVGYAPVAEAFSASTLAEYGADEAADPSRLVDAATGVVSRRLRNGLTLTYLRTAFEPNSALLSLLARGGYRTEGEGSLVFSGSVGSYGALAAPLDAGAVTLGTVAMAEAGCNGLGANAIAQACSLFGISGQAGAHADSEFTAVSLGLTADAAAGAGPGADDGDGLLRALDLALQLMHASLFAPGLNGDAQAAIAFARAKDAFLTQIDDEERDLDGKVANTLDRNAFGAHPSHCKVPRAVAKRLTAEQCTEAVARHFGVRCAGNLQLVCVGDFDAARLEALVERYLGPLPVSAPASSPPAAMAVTPGRFVLPSAATSVATLAAGGGDDAAAAAAATAKPKRGKAKAKAWPAALPSAVAPAQWVAPLPSVSAVLAGTVVKHDDSEERCVIECLFALPSSSVAELARLAEPPWEWGEDGARRLRSHPRFLFRVSYIQEKVLSMRVYRRLRDVLGTSYDARVEASSPHFAAAQPTLTASCTPLASAAPQALAHLVDCCVGFLSGRDPLTRGEFDEAVQPVRAAMPAQERTNAYWSSTLIPNTK